MFLDATTFKSHIRVYAEQIRKLLGFKDNDVFYINGPDVLPAPLSAEEEARCLIELQEKNPDARREIIEHNLRLVVYIAKKFESSNVNIEDLISIGTIGLIKAINTYDIAKNIKLATYASRCIENEILMYLRKTTQIDEPLNVDWDGNELLLSDILGTDSDIVHSRIERETEYKLLFDAISHLDERESEIIKMRFGLCGYKELTQKQVADLMGISQSYISRLEKKIISQLKKSLTRCLPHNI